ncbi:MAG: DUF3302 domain-containing protein [Acuticoccus sp.]
MDLNTFALIMLCIIVVVVVYGIVAVYGLPYDIARRRNHPHREAIGAATWVSLFTLGVLWPFLWIWALLYDPERGWGVRSPAAGGAPFAELEARVERLESGSGR